MIQRGSKISVLMLIIVFCAFAFVGCGTNNDVAPDNNTGYNETEGTNKNTTNNTANNGTTDEDDDEVEITVTEPTEGSTAEGGTIHIVGKAQGTPNPGTDKVHMELLTDEDDKKIGEASSLVADLDYEFSADLKYEISGNMEKNQDGTIDAELRVFIKDENGNEIEDETIDIKIK